MLDMMETNAKRTEKRTERREQKEENRREKEKKKQFENLTMLDIMETNVS